MLERQEVADGNNKGLPRLETGIEGFEYVSKGGLVRGRTTVVVGTSGSGKTLFSTEVLYRSIVDFGRRAVFVTFEELPEDIIANVHRMGWDLEQLIAEQKLTIIDGSLPDEVVQETGAYDLSGIITQIRDAVEEIEADLVFLDSLGGLFEQFNDDIAIRREIFRISRLLRKMGVTSLMTAERLSEYSPTSRHGIEEFVADCVIVLRQHLREERLRRTLQVDDKGLHVKEPFENIPNILLGLPSAEVTDSAL